MLNERAWQEAEQLRAYILAVRNAGFYAQRSITGGRKIDERCAWALEQASRLDPAITSPPIDRVECRLWVVVCRPVSNPGTATFSTFLTYKHKY